MPCKNCVHDGKYGKIQLNFALSYDKLVELMPHCAKCGTLMFDESVSWLASSITNDDVEIDNKLVYSALIVAK